MKQESDSRPLNNYEIENIKDGRCDVVLFDLNSIEEEKRESESGEGITVYKYNSYRVKANHNQALIDKLEKDFDNFLDKAKNQILEADKAIKRAERNRLLDETDKSMAFDRLGITLPDITIPSLSLTNIITFVKSLGEAVKALSEVFKKINSSEMAEYRQKLRDITKDPNFPYVDFPEKPKDVK